MNVITVVLLISLAMISSGADYSVPRVTTLMPPPSKVPLSQTIPGSGKIINGVQAPRGMFKYQVGIEIYLTNGYTWCGGALISQEHVLTAAHCIDKAVAVNLFLGANDRSTPYEVGQVRTYITRSFFIIHEGWSTSTLRNDIAIIRIPTKVTFTDYIDRILLPSRIHQLYADFTGLPSVATGWGYRAGSPTLSRYLQYVNVTIQDQNVCINYLKPWVQPSNICMDGSTGKGACYGDSGSPLASTTSQRYIIGVASFIGYYGCEANWPSVYTRVTYYLDWISFNTGIAIK